MSAAPTRAGSHERQVSAYLGRMKNTKNHHISREEARGIGEAVERFDRVDDAPFAVVLKVLGLTALIRNLDLVQVVAKVARPLVGTERSNG